MTVGPSMANILQFYGHRKGYGLSISPTPLHRNPSYEPIMNPDLQIRSGNLQYFVLDSFGHANEVLLGRPASLCRAITAGLYIPSR